jgi:hypothetical protein
MMAGEDDSSDVEPDIEPKSSGKRLERLLGKVEKSCLAAVIVVFGGSGKTQRAIMYPGRTYVNAGRLLIERVSSDQQMSMLLPVGEKVFMDVVCGGGITLRGEQGLGGLGRPGELVQAQWEVQTLWPTYSEKPRDTALRDGTAFKARDVNFFRAVAWSEVNALGSEKQPQARTTRFTKI